MYQQLDGSLPTSASTLNESAVEEGMLFLSENGSKQTQRCRQRRQHTCLRHLAMSSLGIIFVGLLIMYIIFPFIFYTSSWFRRTLLFEAYLSREDLSNPQKFGLNCTRNFYIQPTPDIQLGTWYIPAGGTPCNETAPMFDGDDRVVLFMHGIKANRGEGHRVRLARRLAMEANVHVLAVDYRGFGDSTYETPSLAGETTDALEVFNVIRRKVPTERIVIWGHSMGTAIALRLAADLQKEQTNPAAIVLESSFDNVGRVTRHSPLSRLWRWMPWFDTIFAQSLMRDPATGADNIQQAYLISPTVPVLMLQAEDDSKTPLDSSDSLRKHIIHSRREFAGAAPVKSILFGKEHKLGHNWLAKYPNVTGVVREFFEKQTIGNGVLDQIVL